eukprot:scaffold86529_cov32-Tisochrysis_lutea.AAC.3
MANSLTCGNRSKYPQQRPALMQSRKRSRLVVSARRTLRARASPADSETHAEEGRDGLLGGAEADAGSKKGEAADVQQPDGRAEFKRDGAREAGNVEDDDEADETELLAQLVHEPQLVDVLELGRPEEQGQPDREAVAPAGAHRATLAHIVGRRGRRARLPSEKKR